MRRIWRWVGGVSLAFGLGAAAVVERASDVELPPRFVPFSSACEGRPVLGSVFAGGPLRTGAGLALYFAKGIDDLLVSGYSAETEIEEFVEGTLQKGYDLLSRVSTSGATDTRENALDTVEWLKGVMKDQKEFCALVVITSEHHVKRSVLAMRKAFDEAGMKISFQVLIVPDYFQIPIQIVTVPLSERFKTIATKMGTDSRRTPDNFVGRTIARLFPPAPMVPSPVPELVKHYGLKSGLQNPEKPRQALTIGF